MKISQVYEYDIKQEQKNNYLKKIRKLSFNLVLILITTLFLLIIVDIIHENSQLNVNKEQIIKTDFCNDCFTINTKILGKDNVIYLNNMFTQAKVL